MATPPLDSEEPRDDSASPDGDSAREPVPSVPSGDSESPDESTQTGNDNTSPDRSTSGPDASSPAGEEEDLDLIEILKEQGIEIPDMSMEELERELRRQEESTQIPEELRADLAELEKELGMSIADVDLDLSKLPGLEELGLLEKDEDSGSSPSDEKLDLPPDLKLPGIEKVVEGLPSDEEIDRVIQKKIDEELRTRDVPPKSASGDPSGPPEKTVPPPGPEITPPARAREPEGGTDAFERAVEATRKLEESAAYRHQVELEKRETELKTKLGRMEKLLAVSRSLSSILDLDDLLNQIIDAVIEITGSMRGFIMLVDDEGVLRFRIGRNREGDSLSQEDFHVSMSVIQEVEVRGESFYSSYLPGEDRFKDQESIIDLDLKTTVCVPLRSMGNLIGVLYADSKYLSEVFSRKDMDILEAFSGQAAVAIENAKLHGRLVHSKEDLERENIDLRHKVEAMYDLAGLVGRSKALRDIFELIQKLHHVDSTVLILGETGTGKELVARALHYNSKRKEARFVPINCGAIPAELLESELFGYRKGAFTGAVEDREGLFEAADKGSIFLDEIGEMPEVLQVKLLRVLQDGEIRRVGDSAPRPVDVRVIAATHRDIQSMVKEGRFRQDLYFRLNVVPIVVPPLRERTEDVLPLAEHFLKQQAEKVGVDPPKLDPSAARFLLQRAWPGNVRELENMIERTMALTAGAKVIRKTDLPLPEADSAGPAAANAGPGGLKEKVERFEKAAILDALDRNEGNISRAADELQTTRQSLHNKIRKYGIRLP